MTMERKSNPKLQAGFSLVELLIVVAILSLVMGVVFGDIATTLKRYKAEESKLDIAQEARDFLDQIVRDLHTSGYPNSRMYTPGVLGGTPTNSTLLSAGLIAVSATDLWFEGDIDGDGTVQNVRYTLKTDSSGNCPCSVQRSDVVKSVAGAPDAVTPVYNVELQNIVNSTGGGSPYTITGSTTFSPGNTVTNDTLYATYKTAPVFAYYNSSGTAVTVPNDLTGSNLATGETAAATVAMISITLNVLSPYEDLQSHLRQSVSMRAMVKMNNL